MQTFEITRWITHHARSLSSFRAWLNTQDIEHIAGLWERPLATVTFDEACEITQLIVSGEIERPFPDETAACIKKEAARLASKRIYQANEITRTNKGIECGLCHGTGIVTIWHNLLVKGYHDQCWVYKHPRTAELFKLRSKDGVLIERTLAAACKCSLGDVYARQTRRDNGESRFVRFGDSPNHVAWTTRGGGLSVEERLAIDVDQQAPRVVEWAIAGDDDNGGFY